MQNKWIGTSNRETFVADKHEKLFNKSGNWKINPQWDIIHPSDEQNSESLTIVDVDENVGQLELS